VESGEFASINAAQRLPESYIGGYWHKPRKLRGIKSGPSCPLRSNEGSAFLARGWAYERSNAFENLAFGKPYWADPMQKTVQLGDLTFFRVKDEKEESDQEIIEGRTKTIDLLRLPEDKSELLIHNGSFRIRFPSEKPCLWWRFWYWALLGWRWRDI